MKTVWLIENVADRVARRPAEDVAEADSPPSDPESDGGMRLENSLLWLLSADCVSEPVSVTWGRAAARSCSYLPCTHFLYSSAFWMSRFCAAAIARACSSVSTRTSAGAVVCAACATASASGVAAGAAAAAAAA